MICELTTVPLTDEQKGQICGILSVGCDRETAANFVGCSIADIGRTMQHDPAFAANARRTEAGAELAHMRNVQQAAKEAKNWRASVWWLERRSPERYGRRSAGQVTARQLEAFTETIVNILIEEIEDDGDRQRIIARLDQAITTLRQMIQSAMPTTIAAASGLPQDSLAISDDESPDLLEGSDDI